MTLRLPPDLDAIVTARAVRDATSKHEVILAALTAQLQAEADTIAHTEAVRDAAQRMYIRWKPLLDRLADA